MATVAALKKVLTETLEAKGVIDELKARIRSDVFHTLEDPMSIKPQLSNENILINELIREYLIYNEYKYTDSVLLAEAGHTTDQFDRAFLCRELNVDDTKESAKFPLLYSLLHHFVQQQKPAAPSNPSGVHKRQCDDK